MPVYHKSRLHLELVDLCSDSAYGDYLHQSLQLVLYELALGLQIHGFSLHHNVVRIRGIGAHGFREHADKVRKFVKADSAYVGEFRGDVFVPFNQ